MAIKRTVPRKLDASPCRENMPSEDGFALPSPTLGESELYHRELDRLQRRLEACALAECSAEIRATIDAHCPHELSRFLELHTEHEALVAGLAQTRARLASASSRVPLDRRMRWLKELVKFHDKRVDELLYDIELLDLGGGD